MERSGNGGRLFLNPPRVVVMTGVAGVGKTNLINGLVDGGLVIFCGLTHYLDTVCLSKDEIANRFTDQRGESYQEKVRPRVYGRILKRTKIAIEQGRTVTIDANFGHVVDEIGWEKPYEDLVTVCGALLKLIRVVATPDVIRDRLIKRNLPYDLDKQQEESFRRWLEREPVEVKMPQGSLIVVNNNVSDFQIALKQILEFIAED